MSTADTQPPVWLLDVDGVLNAISKKPDPSVWPRSSWITGIADAGAQSWPILAASPVLDFVREVHASGAAEIRWLTTWQSYAQTAIAPLLGLPEFPLEHAPEFDRDYGPAGSGFSINDVSGSHWWKQPAAQRVLESGRKLVWTDDDIESYDWYGREKGRLGIPLGVTERSLLVCPQARTGLTRKHLASIRAFIGM